MVVPRGELMTALFLMRNLVLVKTFFLYARFFLSHENFPLSAFLGTLHTSRFDSNGCMADLALR